MVVFEWLYLARYDEIYNPISKEAKIDKCYVRYAFRKVFKKLYKTIKESISSNFTERFYSKNTQRGLGQAKRTRDSSKSTLTALQGDLGAQEIRELDYLRHSVTRKALEGH